VTPKNLAASVHARLAQLARRTNRPFLETLQYYAMERFLYRLCRSPYAERFVLKGALMLRVWDAPTARPTKDVDLLGRMDNSLDNLASVVREICAVEVEPDGLMFQETTVKAERIKVDGCSDAAMKLGMPATTLYSKIQSLKIDKRRFKRD
jgi:Nucleotidyl transferase AbiEii toxin, Type IV TA system